jgi:hypothetical protein
MSSIFDRKTRQPGAAAVILLVTGVLIGFPLIARSQKSSPPSQQATGLRDLSGVWAKPGQAKEGGRFSGTSNVNRNRYTERDEISMTPAGMEIWKFNREGLKNPNENGRIEIDPLRWCYPSGPTRMISSQEPWEIRQFPDEVMILFERDHWTRRIYTDGRGHPEEYPTTWMGHSIGKWDGDTFVVDTVNVNPKSWVDSLGHPQSDAMHIIERFHRENQQFLEVDTTYDDPKIYTKPWTEKKVFELLPPGNKIVEAVYCEEWLAVGKTRGPEKVPYKSYPQADAP